MQRVHFRVGVFNCQQISISTKISVVIFDIVVAKEIEFRLAWHWWNSTDLGLIDMFLINLNAEIVACILSLRKSRHKAKVFPNMVFPPIWGEKMAPFWACACKLSWTLLSPARVQPLYGAGRKESSGTGLRNTWTFQPANEERSSIPSTRYCSAKANHGKRGIQHQTSTLPWEATTEQRLVS